MFVLNSRAGIAKGKTNLYLQQKKSSLMTQTTFMANRLREVWLNGRWIAATNFTEQLEKTTWQQAVQKVGNLNTIAALTFHLNYYTAGLLQVLNGGALDIRDRYSFDGPQIQNEGDWQKLLKTFLGNAESFADAVAQLPDEKLDESFVDEKYGTYRRNLEGVIEHSYYHLGQITLIRKLIEEQKASQ